MAKKCVGGPCSAGAFSRSVLGRLGGGGVPDLSLAAAPNQTRWIGPSGSAASAFKDIRRRAAGAEFPHPERQPHRSPTTRCPAELVDLISALDRQARRAPDAIRRTRRRPVRDASELLGALADAERSPFNRRRLRAARTYDYEPLRDGYLGPYTNCAVRPRALSPTGMSERCSSRRIALGMRRCKSGCKSRGFCRHHP